MHFRVLGPIDVVDECGEVQISGPRERALLAALILSAGEVVSSERLATLLWGEDPPAHARNALQAVVLRLRKALGPSGKDVLVTRNAGYVLAVNGDQVDAVRFEDLLRHGREAVRSDPAGARRLLQDALDLWRGPALQDLADQDLVRQDVARLEELRLAAYEERIEADLALGRHLEVVPELTILIAEHPLRERPREQLMLALYRSGRQADALRLFRDTAALLVRELGVDPGPELQALQQRILRHDPTLSAPVQALPPRRHTLPARISSFVGRDAELADLGELVADRRLVTVIGAGGSGKTSLAIEVARRAVESTSDATAGGVFFVDLAPTADPDRVSAAVATALGLGAGSAASAGTPVPLDAQVEEFARTNGPLLLLDNCEHVIDPVAHLVARILQAAPTARVLATSREPLGLPGEVAWSIPALATPAPSAPAVELDRYDAVRLFQERAEACRSGFSLDAQTAPVVAEICRRLDGLPLAIELAAARTRTLPVEEIARRLDDRFRLLTTGARTAVPRQQTLRAAIDWSYDLLTESERLLFARLSVFAGAWTLEDAEAVCGDDQVGVEEILDLVGRLVDRSMVRPVPGRTARFGLLETIREYARTRLDAGGEPTELRRRHAIHFLSVAESAGAHPESLRRLRAVEEAADDIRAAIRWALTADAADVLLRFAGALGWYWATWHDEEGIDWVNAILAAVRPEASADYGRALLASAFVESYAPSDATRRRAERSVELLDRLDDRSGAGRARLILAFIELMLGGDPALADHHIDSADAAFAQVGDRWGRALAALSRFRLHLHAGRVDRAIEAGQDALSRFRALDDPWGVPWTTMWLGTATRMSGATQEATRLFEQAISTSPELAYVRCTAHAELGVLAALDRSDERAHAHQEAAMQLAAVTGIRDSMAITANATGLIARFLDEPADAKARHRQALAVYEDLGSQIGIAQARCCLGYAEHHLGRVEAAADHLRRALELAHQTGRLDIVAAALEGLACGAASQPHTAALLLGSAQRIRRDTGIKLSLIEGRDPEEAQRRTRSLLGDRYAMTAELGTRLSLDEVVTLALNESAEAF